MKFYWWNIRRGEEEIILGRGTRTSFDLPPNHAVDDPVPRRSCPTVEGVLKKAQFSSPLLYQIHYIGPVGFRFAHIYSERSPPNWDPTISMLIRNLTLFLICFVFFLLHRFVLLKIFLMSHKGNFKFMKSII